MQAPFWKASGSERLSLKRDFMAIAKACNAIGVSHIIVPLVDDGRLESQSQEDTLIEFLIDTHPFLEEQKLSIIFESDYEPKNLERFIGLLPAPVFGINYDVGNSAALGLDPVEEFQSYGHRILNIHIKDRKLGGATVPLGSGNVNFESVFDQVFKSNYKGLFILQTARATNDDHLEVLCFYRDMVQSWLHQNSTEIDAQA